MIKTALTILAVAGSGLLAQGGEPPGDAVATVDGHAIERHVFDHWMTIAARSSFTVMPDPATGYRGCIAETRNGLPAKDRRKVTDKQLKAACEEDYARLRNQVMQLLLSFEWISGEAAAQGVTVTDSEVERDFQEQKRQSFPKEADYRKFLRTSGQSQEDILWRVRLDLLSNRIRDKVVAGKDQVSDEQIAQFYAEHRSLFAVPERRALRLVLTKREADARRARAALERGTSWKAVASRYSIDGASKRDGGKVPAVAEGTLDRPLDKAVFSAAEHRLVGPIRTQHGYYVIRVTRVTPGRRRSLAEVSETIRETLVSEAQQAALIAFVKDFTARWKAKTECAKGYRTTDCRNGPASATSAASDSRREDWSGVR